VTHSIKYENVFHEIFISHRVATVMSVSCMIFRATATTCNIPGSLAGIPRYPDTDSYCISSILRVFLFLLSFRPLFRKTFCKR